MHKITENVVVVVVFVCFVFFLFVFVFFLFFVFFSLLFFFFFFVVVVVFFFFSFYISDFSAECRSALHCFSELSNKHGIIKLVSPQW